MKSTRANHGRSVKLLGVMSLVSAFALLTMPSMPSMHRTLAEGVVVFSHTYWGKYWEDIFAAPFTNIYDGSGDRSASLPHDPNNVGYVLTLTSCPGDSYNTGDEGADYDPGHSFYDAAAVLKYSICRYSYADDSRYNATMYALVHPDAVKCKDPNGQDYDRVEVLQELGYHVSIVGSQIYDRMLQDPFVKENLPIDSGERDFMRLDALSMDNHPIVVSVDFRTFVIQNLDSDFDSFLNSNEQMRWSMDYPTNVPSTGSNLGPNLHWIMMRPNRDLEAAIIAKYAATSYTTTWGWNNQGVKDFEGVLGIKGFLMHYYNRIDVGKLGILQRCYFGNDNSNPMDQDQSGSTICRDHTDCQDCRAVSFDRIKVLKMMDTCGKPWECSYDDTWEPTAKVQCENYHRAWFEARKNFEDSYWQNGIPSFHNGTFHPNVFLGYCNCAGQACYDRMIDDKA